MTEFSKVKFRRQVALPLKLDTTNGTPAMFPFQKVKQSYRSCHKIVKLTCLGAGLTLIQLN